MLVSKVPSVGASDLHWLLRSLLNVSGWNIRHIGTLAWCLPVHTNVAHARPRTRLHRPTALWGDKRILGTRGDTTANGSSLMCQHQPGASYGCSTMIRLRLKTRETDIQPAISWIGLLQPAVYPSDNQVFLAQCAYFRVVVCAQYRPRVVAQLCQILFLSVAVATVINLGE